MNNIFLTSLIICFISCSTTTQKGGIASSGSASKNQVINSFPKVDLKITLKDTILNYGDNILLNISLTNNGNEVKKLLFDKPRISTGGPWATTGKVIDVKSNRSVLKYENKAMLSSQLYIEDQLKNDYYFLRPGQTISGQYELKDIVVFNTSDYKLPKGTYEVQLFYHSNPSNVITINIQ